MSNFDNRGIRDLTSPQKAYVLASGELTVGCPCGLYLSSAGVLTGIKVAADVNTIKGHWGIPEATIDDTESGFVIIQGSVDAVSGGTAGQVVTAISNAGALTSAAAANTNVDTNILGTCTDTGSLYIF